MCVTKQTPDFYNHSDKMKTKVKPNDPLEEEYRQNKTCRKIMNAAQEKPVNKRKGKRMATSATVS